MNSMSNNIDMSDVDAVARRNASGWCPKKARVAPPRQTFWEEHLAEKLGFLKPLQTIASRRR